MLNFLRGIYRMKASLLVWKYMETLWQSFPAGAVCHAGAYTGRSSAKAPKLKPNCMKELQSEVPTLVRLEKTISAILRHYVVKNPDLDKVMIARTMLLAGFGRCLVRVGLALDAESMKAAATRLELTHEAREAVIENALKGVIPEIEAKYRGALLEAQTYANVEAAPLALFPKEEKKKPEAKETAEAVAIGADSASGSGSLTNELCLSPDAVLQRLGLQAPALGSVCLRSLKFLADEGQPGGGDDADVSGAGAAEASEDTAADRKQQLRKARLVGLARGKADVMKVEATIEYSGTNYIVDSDLLVKCAEGQAVVAPPPREKHDLPATSWDALALDQARAVALWTLDQFHVQTYSAVEGVSVEQLGKLESAPITLRVKALQHFDKGALVLAPHLGRFSPTLLLNSKEPQCNKYENPDKQEMDSASIERAYARVVTVERKPSGRSGKRMQEEAAPALEETCFMVSPLFLTRKCIKDRAPVTTNMSPFWAIPRSVAAKDVNMKIEPYTFSALPPKGVGIHAALPSPLKGPMLNVSIQAAVNVKKVKTGEYLYVSLMRESLGDDE